MDYKLAEKIVKRNDARTCSFCLCTSQEAFAFRKHEETVREGRNAKKQFNCPSCGNKLYRKFALNRHINTVHKE